MQIKFLKIKSYSKFTGEACFISSQREEKCDYCNTISSKWSIWWALIFMDMTTLELGSTAGPWPPLSPNSLPADNVGNL